MPSLYRLALAAVLSAGLLAGCGRDGRTVASINKSKISLADFNQQLRDLQGNRPLAADETTKRQVLEQMVKQEILAQAALLQGLDKDPAVQQRVSEQTQQFRQQLESSLERDQYHLKNLDREVKNNLLIQALLEKRVKDSPVPEKEAKAFYDNLAKQNGGKNMPPFAQIQDRIQQQLVMDRLVAEYKEKVDVEEHPELLSDTKASSPAKP